MTIDLRDLFLEVTAEIEETLRETLQELTEPQDMAEIYKVWMALPDEMKEQFKRERPDEYADMMDLFE